VREVCAIVEEQGAEHKQMATLEITSPPLSDLAQGEEQMVLRVRDRASRLLPTHQPANIITLARQVRVVYAFVGCT
jgi:hypothetical protein